MAGGSVRPPFLVTTLGGDTYPLAPACVRAGADKYRRALQHTEKEDGPPSCLPSSRCKAKASWAMSLRRTPSRAPPPPERADGKALEKALFGNIFYKNFSTIGTPFFQMSTVHLKEGWENASYAISNNVAFQYLQEKQSLRCDIHYYASRGDYDHTDSVSIKIQKDLLPTQEIDPMVYNNYLFYGSIDDANKLFYFTNRNNPNKRSFESVPRKPDDPFDDEY